MATPAPQSVTASRRVRVGLIVTAALVALAVPVVGLLAAGGVDRNATPAELLRAVAGLVTDPAEAVPPFGAASRLEPDSFLALAQDPSQAETLMRLFTEPRDVLAPRGEAVVLLEPRGRVRDPRPLFRAVVRTPSPSDDLRIHLLDLDRDGGVRRIPLPGETAHPDLPGLPGLRLVRPAVHGLLPGRYAWWIEAADPLDAPLLGARATATFTVLDRELARTVEQHLPPPDGGPQTRLRRAAVLLCAGLAQEALRELDLGGFDTDRAPTESTDGDPVQECATLLAAAAWRRLGDLDAVARQISALVHPR